MSASAGFKIPFARSPREELVASENALSSELLRSTIEGWFRACSSRGVRRDSAIAGHGQGGRIARRPSSEQCYRTLSRSMDTANRRGSPRPEGRPLRRGLGRNEDRRRRALAPPRRPILRMQRAPRLRRKGARANHSFSIWRQRSSRLTPSATSSLGLTKHLRCRSATEVASLARVHSMRVLRSTRSHVMDLLRVARSSFIRSSKSDRRIPP